MVDRPDRRHSDNKGLDGAHAEGERLTDRRVMPDRRRLLQGSAAGSVLAVFYPRTGLGAEPSVHASAACSFVGVDRQCELGLSPGFWRRNKGLWASDYQRTRPFDEAFDMNINRVFVGKASSQEATLEDVITFAVEPDEDLLTSFGSNGDSAAQVSQLGFQAVAALQNAATIVPYRLKVSEVKDRVRGALESGDIGQVKLRMKELEDKNNRSSLDQEERLKQLLGG